MLTKISQDYVVKFGEPFTSNNFAKAFVPCYFQPTGSEAEKDDEKGVREKEGKEDGEKGKKAGMGGELREE